MLSSDSFIPKPEFPEPEKVFPVICTSDMPSNSSTSIKRIRLLRIFTLIEQGDSCEIANAGMKTSMVLFSIKKSKLLPQELFCTMR